VTADDEAALRSAEEIELVTTGRRSGRPHVVTLWSAYEDGALWLRAEPRCRVRFAGREVEGRYEPIAADHEQSADNLEGLRHLIGLWRKKYGNEWVGDWYVERGRIPLRVRIVNTA